MILLVICSSVDILPSVFANYKINKIHFRFMNKIKKKDNNYLSLLNIKEGEYYSLEKIRKSISNLNKTSQFQNIEVKGIKLKEKKLNLIFILHFKLSLSSFWFAFDRKATAFFSLFLFVKCSFKIWILFPFKTIYFPF